MPVMKTREELLDEGKALLDLAAMTPKGYVRCMLCGNTVPGPGSIGVMICHCTDKEP